MLRGTMFREILRQIYEPCGYEKRKKELENWMTVRFIKLAEFIVYANYQYHWLKYRKAILIKKKNVNFCDNMIDIDHDYKTKIRYKISQVVGCNINL